MLRTMQLQRISLTAVVAMFTITISTLVFNFPVVSIPIQALPKTDLPANKEANHLIQKGKKQLDTNNFEAALQSYQQALVIYQSIRNIFGEADAFNGLGNVCSALKDYKQAIDYYQQSLKIAQKSNHLEKKEDSLSNLANTYSALKDYKQAIDYYQQSLEILQGMKEKLGDCKYQTGSDDNAHEEIDKECQSSSLAISIRKFDSMNALANAYFALGNFKAVIDSYKQSLTIIQEINDQKRKGDSLSNLGNAYSALGDYKQAIDYHKQSLTIAQKINDLKRKGDSLSNLGNAYSALGDYKQAIDYHKQSLTIAQKINDRYGEGDSLVGLGNAYSAIGDFQQAIDYYKHSLKNAQEITDRKAEGHSLNGLGNVYSALGDYKQAIDYHKQSLKISQEINDRKGEGDSLNNLGLTLLKEGNPQAAETTLRQSIKVWELIWASLEDNDTLKISFFETQANTYRLLQQALIDQNKTEAALEIAEQGRARAFLELVAQHQKIYLYPPLYFRQIIDIARQQKATLVVYSIAWDDLYIWVVKQTGEISFHKVDMKKINLGNVAEDARTAAATLAQGRGIATNMIKNLVSSTRSVFPKRSDNPSSSQRTNAPRTLSCRGNNCLQQMYELLIQPIAAELPTNSDSHVIFIPHESLFLVPFAALQDPTNKKFLIENYTISIAPSIQALELTHARRMKLQESVRQRSAVGVDIPQAALVVGNPTMPTIGNPPQRLDPLPGAEKEAQVIAELLKTQALTGKQATKAAVEQQMAGAKIIHLATHGLLDELSEPGNPGALALAPSGKDNGLLSANEVLNLHLNADLVVLSACDTGRGRITGDGVIGLSRSFITAGTPSVIVSLWRVGDGSTASLMPEFYRQLQHNPNKASALRQAMLNTMKAYPNPSDWAAFLLIGEAE